MSEYEYKNIYEDLLKYDYQTLLRDALNKVPNDVDKREGSIIYDALAPLCMLSVRLMEALYAVCIQSRFQTATGEYLDMCGSQIGIYRSPAAYAKWKIQTLPNNIQIEIGQRFVSFEGLGLEYEVYEGGNGYYSVRCLEAGSKAGNDYGHLEPSTAIAGLESAKLLTKIDGGSDAQSDTSYRNKIWRKSQRKGFGGNFQDYCEWIFYEFLEESNIKITAFQFYPAWEGGGTVKLAITQQHENGNYYPANGQTCVALEAYLDPEDNTYVSGSGAGRVPVGHRVTVVAPNMYNMGFRITLDIDGYLTNEIKDKAKQATLNYLEEIRAQALTLENSTQVSHYEGYFTWYRVAIHIAKIALVDNRIKNIYIEKRNNDGSFSHQPDEHIASDKDTQWLPCLSWLSINNEVVFGG